MVVIVQIKTETEFKDRFDLLITEYSCNKVVIVKPYPVS